MPDSFCIVQWKEEYYRPVKMVRRIAWAKDYFAEVFTVEGADPQLPIDWVMHFSGRNVSFPEGQAVERISEKKPYKHITSVTSRKMRAGEGTFVTVYEDEGITTHVFGSCQGQTLLGGQGPDNPSSSKIPYQIEREYGGTGIFAHVITSSDGECKIRRVEFETGNENEAGKDSTGEDRVKENRIRIEVTKADGTRDSLFM